MHAARRTTHTARKTAPLLKSYGLAALAALGLSAAHPQAAQAQAGSLTTTYASNNSGRMGFYFDLTALNALTVNSFDVNTTEDQQVDVYYRAGSYQGNEGAAGWTLLGSSPVLTQGGDTPSTLGVGGLTLAAGQTDGVYLFFDGDGGTVPYTNGAETYSTPDLSLFSDEANYSRFGTGPGELANRVWNGTVNYTAAPEPSSVAAFAFVGLGALGLVLKARRRRIAA